MAKQISCPVLLYKTIIRWWKSFCESVHTWCPDSLEEWKLSCLFSCGLCQNWVFKTLLRIELAFYFFTRSFICSLWHFFLFLLIFTNNENFHKNKKFSQIQSKAENNRENLYIKFKSFQFFPLLYFIPSHLWIMNELTTLKVEISNSVFQFKVDHINQRKIQSKWRILR